MLTLEQKINLVERALFEPLLNDTIGTITASDTWVQAVTPAIPMEFANRVYRSVLGEDEADARIAATIEQFRSIGTPFQWIVTPMSRPASLPERLLAAGLRQGSVAYGLIADPRQIKLMPKNPDVTIEAVSEENLDDWVRLQVTGWGLPEAVSGMLRARTEERLRSNDGWWMALLGRINGALAGGISISFCDGYAYTGEGIVLPEHRRHQVGRTFHRTCIDILRERGVPYVAVHAVTTTSAPILMKLGYESVCEIGYYRYP